jgi:hypothetical protein
MDSGGTCTDTWDQRYCYRNSFCTFCTAPDLQCTGKMYYIGGTGQISTTRCTATGTCRHCTVPAVLGTGRMCSVNTIVPAVPLHVPVLLVGSVTLSL